MSARRYINGKHNLAPSLVPSLKSSNGRKSKRSGITHLNRPTERSFYPPLAAYLESLGFEALSEIGSGEGFVDILFRVGKHKFVLELKIDRKDDAKALLDGIAQAYKYSLIYETGNYLTISYPPRAAAELTDDMHEEVKERALKTKVNAEILTDNWIEYTEKLTVEEILSNLKARIDKKLLAVLQVQHASDVIKKCVITLSKLLQKYYHDEKSLEKAARSLTKDYGFFIEATDPEARNKRIRSQTIDLLAYILVNQIIFYFLYSKKSQELAQSKRVDEMKTVSYLPELETKYFAQIKAIDYRPIYDIPVVESIPSHAEILDVVNSLIECLTPLRITEIKQDLYGRLIGSVIPNETRKVLASFYTKTIPADLLANLTIGDFDDTVWDFACGSGTLLFCAYNAKLQAYRKYSQGIEQSDRDDLHRTFIENEITGTDVMPFACHLTGLNLSAQNLRIHTNLIRVSNRNSLTVRDLDEPEEMEEAYGGMRTLAEALKYPQNTLDEHIGNTPREATTYTPPKKFLVERVDCALINPPFTNINKLPDDYRKELTASPLASICGKRAAPWCYFLALANNTLKSGGRIGAIIPISFLKGQDTDKIRRHYLENYSIKYIIKPNSRASFSEDSDFTDIIIVAERVKPQANSVVRIVLLKQDIDGLNGVELARTIKRERRSEADEEIYFSFTVRQQELLQNADNLMKYVFTSSGKAKNACEIIANSLIQKDGFTKIKKSDIRFGYQIRPKKAATNYVINRRHGDEKMARSLLSFESDSDNDLASLTYQNSKTGQSHTVPKSKLVKTFRTSSRMARIDATGMHDYMFREKANIDDKTNLLIFNKFRLNSPDTHLLAAYTNEDLCPTNLFTMYRCGKDEAKLLSLYLNSVFYLVQLLMVGKQSTGGYTGISHVDLTKVLIPIYANLSPAKQRETSAFFDKISHQTFESLSEQFKNKSDYRLDLDKTVADILGLKVTRQELRGLYDLMHEIIIEGFA
jgi:type I restriction-modification system DNA methylase subunit